MYILYRHDDRCADCTDSIKMHVNIQEGPANKIDRVSPLDPVRRITTQKLE